MTPSWSRAFHQVHCRKAQDRPKEQCCKARSPSDVQKRKWAGLQPWCQSAGKNFLRQKKDHLTIKVTCENIESLPKLNLSNAGDARPWRRAVRSTIKFTWLQRSNCTNWRKREIHISLHERKLYCETETSSAPRKANKTRQQRQLRRMKKNLKKKFKQAVKQSRIGKMRQNFLQDDKNTQQSQKTGLEAEREGRMWPVSRTHITMQKTCLTTTVGRVKLISARKLLTILSSQPIETTSANIDTSLWKDPQAQTSKTELYVNVWRTDRSSTTEEEWFCTWHICRPVFGV